MTAVLVLLFAFSAPIAGARWFRVAQREHYLAGEVTKFAARWWTTGRKNPVLLIAAVGAAIAALFVPWLAVISINSAALGPLGLSMRGRTSPLVWTRRLKTVAATSTVLLSGIIVAGVVAGAVGLAVGLSAVCLPLIVDVALRVLAPVERRAASGFVESARERLDRVGPIRVAITGSYGKTTIKGYVRHLAGTQRSVVASPASFNNTGGLSRTVNEMLANDTEVFIAEMGAYGPGEIADLCSWVKPDIAVLCNIGPVHLERFGSLDSVVTSKSEIFQGATTCIVNVDAYGLAEVAIRLMREGKQVITCSEHADTADVRIVTRLGTTSVNVGGFQHEVSLPSGAAPINAACAVAVALSLDVPVETILQQLPTLPGADHRCEVSVSQAGITVVDDTYNSNPAGAAAALAALSSVDARRRVVVTPGMVELGSQQADANTAFARDAAQLADDLIIVGETNRAALDAGHKHAAAVHHVRFRAQAVEWVKKHLDAGDAVLYENDLPDHYP
jgi:UDP-N-acetylmuramoyl-tripeptide--D-alanyl-D-alanine ligase